MEDTSIDESVSQFMAITGSADANQARSYLEMSGNDLQTAISLFLEHQSGPGSSGGAGGSSGTGTGNGPDLDVRAPDATQRGVRLMDFEDGGGGAAARRMGAGLMDHPFLGPHAMMMSGSMGMGGMGMGGANAGFGGIGSARMNAFADDEDMEDHANAHANIMNGMNSMANVHDVDMSGDIPVSLRDVMNRAASESSARSGAGAGTGAGLLDHMQRQTSQNSNHSEHANANPTNANAIANSNANANANTRLSSMFAPPDHLTHRAGGFQGARNVAKDTRRWLLVNLQSDSDFACHALNRDVWRDELVENLVREGYIFWQSQDTQEDGRTYCERYNVTSFPHIGIIDPRTARLVYRKEGWTQENPMTPEAFAEIAADFCSRHSFDKAPVAPRIGSGGAGNADSSDVGAAAAAAIASDGGNAASSGARVDEMTEEEQLQAAIRASMNDAVQNDDDSSVEYIMEEDDEDDDVLTMDDGVQIVDSSVAAMTPSADTETGTRTTAVAPAAPAPVPVVRSEPTFIEQIIAMEVGEEPSADAARIMIRMPDGKRLVRRFKMDDNVKIIYAFVAQSNDDAKGGKEFVMKAGFPPKDLVDSVDKSIESTGLAGDSITVRWKED